MSNDTTIQDIYKKIGNPKSKVETFQSVLEVMTAYLKDNESIYNYNDTQELPKTIGDENASAIIDSSNKTFTINLFTSVEFLSKIPGDGFHDFLTMGRNDTFKDVKSEFIFIYILGNFMKNIMCMKTDEHKNDLIANTLYTYAAAMKLFSDKTAQTDEDVVEEIKAPVLVPTREKSSRAAAAPPVNTDISVSKDGLGDGNDIAHRMMESKTELMTGKGECNKIVHRQLFQSDDEKAINILYYVDNNGGILQILYDSWIKLCATAGVKFPAQADTTLLPTPEETGNDRKRMIHALITNKVNIIIRIITDETVRKINIDTLFANAAPINTPEWYKIQYVKNMLEKYTTDYVNALYTVFTKNRVIKGFKLTPDVLPITTIPYLEKLNDDFLDFDFYEGLKDMEFNLAKLLFKERIPLYFFADANHGKVGPGILQVLRSHPVLLIESSVIDLDEASEGFSKTTQELNKVHNPTVSTSYDPGDDNSTIITQIKNGKTFIFNFYSDDKCLIEQFIISESPKTPEKIALKDKISALLKVNDFSTLEKKQAFITAVLDLFSEINEKDDKMKQFITTAINTDYIKNIININTKKKIKKIEDRIKYIIADNGEKKFEKPVKIPDEIPDEIQTGGKKGKKTYTNDPEVINDAKVLDVGVNGPRFILIKMKQYFDNDSHLQITNRFVTGGDITQISVNNMTDVAVQNLKTSLIIVPPPQAAKAANNKAAKQAAKEEAEAIAKLSTPSALLRRLNTDVISAFSPTDNSTNDTEKNKIINTIQNFLIPLTAKRTGDLLPLCLWGFLKDKPNKFYDTGDLNAFQLGLLLLTSKKNVSLFQDLLLACPGTDEMQDFLRLVRCGNNDKFFPTAYTGPGQNMPMHIIPLHDCIPPIFNPTFVLNPDDPKDPCPKSFQEVQELNNGATPMIIQEVIPVAPAPGDSEAVEGQMDTTEAEAEANARVENATIASGVPAPSTLKRSRSQELSDAQSVSEQEERDVKKTKDEKDEKDENLMDTKEGGQKRKKLKTIKKRNPKVQRKTIKNKTKMKPLK